MLNRRHSVFAAISVATVLGLTACSVPPVEAVPPVDADSAACTKADAQWPATVASLKPYPVTTPSDSVRAWGKRPEHAIIARCGVVPPGPTQDACIDVDGVDWVQRSLGKDGYQYVTYGREPGIEVLVPSDIGGTPATYLPAFTKAAKEIPQGSHKCIG